MSRVYKKPTLVTVKLETEDIMLTSPETIIENDTIKITHDVSNVF